MHRHEILILDHDDELSASVSALLSRIGWTAWQAKSTSEALQQIESGAEPCCLMISLGLLDSSAGSIIKRLRDKLLRPFIVLCASASEVGSADVKPPIFPDMMLTKPLTVAELVALVAALDIRHGP